MRNGWFEGEMMGFYTKEVCRNLKSLKPFNPLVRLKLSFTT
jgi:hypothetical protein